MQLVAVPLDMISEPNFFTPFADARWEIIDPNAVDLWFQLQISDSLGKRRYIPAAGSVLTVVFQRADLIANNSYSQLTNTVQNISKVAVASADDRSLMKVSLSSTEVKGIVSGSIKYTLVEASATTTWVANWALYKKKTDAGF